MFNDVIDWTWTHRRTLPTAVAAPVAEGMMFSNALRPPLQSFPPFAGPSTVSCDAVAA